MSILIAHHNVYWLHLWIVHLALHSLLQLSLLILQFLCFSCILKPDKRLYKWKTVKKERKLSMRV